MKGLMLSWILGIMGLFILSLLFITFNEAYQGGIFDQGNSIRASDTTARNVFTLIDGIWNNLPILFAFLFVIFAIVVGQRESEPFQGGV